MSAMILLTPHIRMNLCTHASLSNLKCCVESISLKSELCGVNVRGHFKIVWQTVTSCPGVMDALHLVWGLTVHNRGLSLVTDASHWPLIGWHRSRDLNAGLWLADTACAGTRQWRHWRWMVTDHHHYIERAALSLGVNTASPAPATTTSANKAQEQSSHFTGALKDLKDSRFHLLTSAVFSLLILFICPYAGSLTWIIDLVTRIKRMVSLWV